jgi:hypothetical protein
VLLPDVVLSPEDLRTLKAEWNKILKEEHDLPELKLGTRETRAIPTTRQTTKGRSRTQQVTQERMSSVAHDLASGVKVNTLIQREIRLTRQTKKAARYAEDEIPLLSQYVDKMSAAANPLCQGGCFALVKLHHLELKRLAPYAATADEVFAALERERRESVRNATKYERKAAKRSGLSNDVTQERINQRRARIALAYEQAEVFRRGHCIKHG